MLPLRTLAALLATTLVAFLALTSLQTWAQPPPAQVSEHFTSQRFVLPVTGEVRNLFDPPDKPWQSGHRGVDIAANPGAHIVAPASGIIAYVGSIDGVPIVSIDHANGIRTTYQPIDAALKQGEYVKQGDLIGYLSSGDAQVLYHCAPNSCLHWGARTGPETYIDPLSLLERVTIRLYPAVN